MNWSISKILTYFKRTAGAKRHFFNQEWWDSKEYKDYISDDYYELVLENGDFKSNASKDYYGVWNDQNQSQYNIAIPVSFVRDEENGNYKRYEINNSKRNEFRIRMFNFAYDGSNGNVSLSDDSNSQDGYNFRGRGAIQLTGRANYQSTQDALNKWFKTSYDIVSNPDLVGTDKKLLVYSATAFLLKYVSNADEFDDLTIDEVSALVNTGNKNNSIANVNGGEDRSTRYNNLIMDSNLFKCDDDDN